MGILSLFLLVGLGFFNLSYADSARDRCSVTDCICYVRPGNSVSPTTSIATSQRRHVVYFNEGSSELSDYQVSTISSFIRRPGSSASVTIMGFTDGCGTREYNANLSARRAQAVGSIIREENSRISINTTVGGERVQYHSSQSRRVDIIIHTQNRFTTRIEEIPADVYLIDGSGSMWSSRSEWVSLVNASFRPGSKIYMSMMTGCYNGQNLDSISPQGGTEIWYSYYTVINRMRDGETLLIISDFDSNYRIQQWERDVISEIVRRKNLTVYTIRP